MSLSSSRARFEVRVISADGKPVTDVRVTASGRSGQPRVLGFDERAMAWMLSELEPGPWDLHVESSGLEAQDRTVMVTERGLQALFILGPREASFYYRGGAKVPFDLPETVAVSLKPGMESEGNRLTQLADELGLEQLKLPREAPSTARRDATRDIDPKLLEKPPEGARLQPARSERVSKSPQLLLFSVPRGVAQATAFEERVRELPFVRRVGKVVHKTDNSISFLTNEILVEIERAADVATIARARELSVVRQLKYAGSVFLLRAAKIPTRELLETCNQMRQDRGVVWAEPNLASTVVPNFTPNDFEGQLHHPLIGSECAWDVVRAHQVGNPLIAVIDTGCDITHPDLAANLRGQFDFFSRTTTLFPSPHGTMTAGVIAAEYDNGLGIAGVAGMCGFLAIQLPELDGSDEEYASMFRWCAGLDPEDPTLPAFPSPGADVISNSWGLGEDRPLATLISCALDDVTVNGRGGKGCVVVFASGNDGSDFMIKQPWATHPNVIAVGSSMVDTEVRAPSSNIGAQLDVCAPGGDVLGATWSTTASTVPQTGTVGEYDCLGQTSCACAQVAGAAALLLTVNPGLSAAEVQQILQQTAEQIDVGNPDPAAAYDSNGHSQWYGFGRMRLCKAVKAARDRLGR